MTNDPSTDGALSLATMQAQIDGLSAAAKENAHMRLLFLVLSILQSAAIILSGVSIALVGCTSLLALAYSIAHRP